MEQELDALEQGDRIEVTLTDGTALVGRLQDAPDTGPPTTPDGEAAGWDEKTLLGGVAVQDPEADYETLLLTQERYGEEWASVEGVGYYYNDDRLDYEQDDLDVQEVETL